MKPELHGCSRPSDGAARRRGEEEEAKEVDWKEEEEGDTGAGSPLEEVEKVLKCFAAPRSQVRRTRTSGQIRPQVVYDSRRDG